jgi:hypothetical protein
MPLKLTRFFVSLIFMYLIVLGAFIESITPYEYESLYDGIMSIWDIFCKYLLPYLKNLLNTYFSWEAPNTFASADTLEPPTDSGWNKSIESNQVQQEKTKQELNYCTEKEQASSEANARLRGRVFFALVLVTFFLHMAVRSG